jgi:hypothetical protein
VRRLTARQPVDGDQEKRIRRLATTRTARQPSSS